MSIRVTSIQLRKQWLIILFLLIAAILIARTAYHRLSTTHPHATAVMIAGPHGAGIQGQVTFRDVSNGVVVATEITGLPPYNPGDPPIGPHGFHIHEGSRCEVGDPADPFQSAGGHWNPDDQPHGNHAGDFPVLFSQDGAAEVSFTTDRFKTQDIIGRTVIIHRNPDDYRSQPAGDSGIRIACGVIARHGG